MGFFLKKLLGELLMPLPVCLLLAGVGWVLWHRGRRPRLARGLVGGSLLTLLLLSLSPVSDFMAIQVESEYPAFPGDSVDFVVVLGSSYVSDPELPPSALLSVQGLYRLVEGVRIAHAQPWATLVLSGWGDTDPVSNAEVYREVAASLGFPAERTRVEPRPRDTAEEAQVLEPLLSGHRFALVTSATHMPRAVALFRGRGLNPVPAPTGHLVKGGVGWGRFDAYLPDEGSLAHARQAWYEMLGRVWIRLRGQE
ncbi:MAG TPA: envelope biogenesis factor ElyC [Longimicrobiales bacterium]|nr:envelope biogenesis factor ElyC [Longimicrobiales bacterium]